MGTGSGNGAQGTTRRCARRGPKPRRTPAQSIGLENSEERRRAASLGGKAKTSPLTRELHRRLEELTNSVVDGSLVAYRGAVAAQLINARIRLVEVERRVHEQEELVERLERLERSRGAGGASVWGA